ncbi:MAG: metal-dependent transcriptional regulator [Actinomycetota bacterium]
MPYESAEHHPAFEEYSETIFELDEDGVEVIQARIAERLEVSRPAVSEMVRRMEREGLVEIGADSRISLTDEGRQLATTVVRRHRLAERFLTDVLELSWAEAHHEAGRWEHVISPAVEDALSRVLGDPKTCPHGNPIPGADYAPPTGACALGQVPVQGSFVVERIPEELEFQPGELAYLEEGGVMPGREGKVVSSAPDGTTTLAMGDSIIGISAFSAERILVTVVDQAATAPA